MTEERESDGKVPESFRWQLAADFRKRADQSADFLRVLLFALASASAAYVANQDLQKFTALHALSFASLAAAIVLLVLSWNLQKSKSIRRYKTIRDQGYEKFLEEERKIEENIFHWNSMVDVTSYFLIVIGIVFEVSAKICALGVK